MHPIHATTNAGLELPSVGEQIGRLQSRARDLRQRAIQLDAEARKCRWDADEAERMIECIRVAR